MGASKGEIIVQELLAYIVLEGGDIQRVSQLDYAPFTPLGALSYPCNPCMKHPKGLGV